MRAATRSVYPFTAIVGQDEMKLALVLNVIDPLLGGVLIMGHRGTGKSTAVRGLAELLPEINVVADCAYQCEPDDQEQLCEECQGKRRVGKLKRKKMRVTVVDLPLGATEDRVCGSIDIESALKRKAKTFELGLLARANRGFLYVDEVNLLEDHLVDLLLDVAVTGRNRVERESMSVEHPARFVLIGSGNPEEGELRPQLLDRFGLQVEVVTENDPDCRVEVITRRELFEADRNAFLGQMESEQAELRKRISRARKLFASVKIESHLLRKIAELCTQLRIDGHRGELTITRASRALAAFENRKRVTDEEIKRVAGMALRHRLRREPFEETGSNERIDRALKTVLDEELVSGSTSIKNRKTPVQNVEDERADDKQSPRRTSANGQRNGGGELSLPPMVNDGDSKFDLKTKVALSRPRDLKLASRNQSQVATKSKLNSKRGRYARATKWNSKVRRIAIDATLRAGAIRYKEFSRKEGVLYILAIDTSGSMARRRIDKAREVALALLRQSYIKRDSVAIVAFRGISGQLILSPSRSMLRAKRALETLTVGGGTPLSAGLALCIETARRSQSKHGRAVAILFSDGRANVPLRSDNGTNAEQRQQQVHKELLELSTHLHRSDLPVVVIATLDRFASEDDARQLAETLGAEFIQAPDSLNARR